MPENRRTSIVILTRNNLQNSSICLESIRDYTPSEAYEIIVVDNNSTDGTREWLKEQWDIKLILSDEEVGFSMACNKGIELADKENDILLLNNNIKVTPRWLNNLKKCLYSSDEIGAVSSVTNNCGNCNGIEVNYNDIDEMISFAYKNNISSPEKWEQRACLSGLSVLVKREAINKVGLLDEEFTLENFSNNDFSIRILIEGCKLMLCNDSFVHNLGGETFERYSTGSSDILKVNKQKFQEKWGFSHSIVSLEEADIIKLVDEPENKNLNILQLDCNLGAALLKLKYNYPNANLYGLEVNENAGRICRRIFQIGCEDFESNYTLSFKEAKEDFFDYIILGERLQKSLDPWKMLRSLKRFLKPGGYIIARIPNAMYYLTIKNLLSGKYIYSENPIFNRSYNRYFTFKDIDSIAVECGYLKPYVTYNTEKVTQEEEEFLEAVCGIMGKGNKEQFIPREFIAKLQKESSHKNLSHKEVLIEVKYALRRIEHNIDKFNSLGLIKELYEKEEISMTDVNRIIASDVINKAEVEAVISNYLR